MGKTLQRAGGGKVTVTGLDPNLIASGMVVTVKQGNKIIEQVTGDAALVSRGQSYDATSVVGNRSATRSNLSAGEFKVWVTATTSIGFDLTLWDRVYVAGGTDGGNWNGITHYAYETAVIVNGSVVRSSASASATFDVSDLTGKALFRVSGQVQNSFAANTSVTTTISNVTVYR